MSIRRVYKRADVTNLTRLLEVGDNMASAHLGPCDRTVERIGEDIVIEWTARLQKHLEAQTDRIKSARVIATALVEKGKMGKLQEVAQRIAATKKSLEAEADVLASKLDEISKKAPEAFNRGHAILDQHHADLDAMEGELRQLSNLPLE